MEGAQKSDAPVIRYYVGTSGWSYPTGEGSWKGTFYPQDQKVDELVYYSQFFRTVEINSSFYRPPSLATVRHWARRVPREFLFSVKLWQKFTHPQMYRDATGDSSNLSHEDIKLFQAVLELLAGEGKLGAVLAQFPPGFKNVPENVVRLAMVIEGFAGYRLAVELRHRSWSDDPSTETLLSRHNVAWVQIDEPKFSFSIAERLPQTADFAYFRFHGRNAEQWWTGDVETRYKYLYSESEIRELAQKVKSSIQGTGLVFAYFNNHWKGYAPRNAGDFMKQLSIF